MPTAEFEPGARAQLARGTGSARPAGGKGARVRRGSGGRGTALRRRRSGWGNGLRRGLHPLAWWAWALALAVAVSRAANPLVIGLVLAAVLAVVYACREDSPWARAFRTFLVIGAVIVAVRVAFYVLVGLPDGSPVLVHLPAIALPGWVISVEVLGPVHAAGLLGAIYDGLRLGTLIVCFGAANTLANPKRALRCLPASLHHLGTAAVIAVSVTPQLVRAVGRVRRAQRLRGIEGRGLRALTARLLPVLTDALDHALALAASMDSRGYARTVRTGAQWRVNAALVVALLAAVAGTYGLLDASAPAWLGVTLLAAGAAVAVAASVFAGRNVRRTTYRPDPWAHLETAVVACGVLACAAIALAGALDPHGMSAALSPLAWPGLPPLAVLGAVLAALPAIVAPSPSSAISANPALTPIGSDA